MVKKRRIPEVAKCDHCKRTFDLPTLRERKDYKPGICPMCGGSLKSVYESKPPPGLPAGLPGLSKGHYKKRTAFYIQYWSPKEAGPSADPYTWGGAYDSLRKALDAANECEEKKPEAFDLEIYSREEKWIPDEEDPRFGYWESIDGTTKVYDRRGAVVWSELEIEPKTKETPLEKWERQAKARGMTKEETEKTKNHRFER